VNHLQRGGVGPEHTSSLDLLSKAGVLSQVGSILTLGEGIGPS